MQTSEQVLTAMQLARECVSPVLGKLLPDYVAELLQDLEVERFELHLLDCGYCRNFLLMFFGKQIPPS